MNDVDLVNIDWLKAHEEFVEERVLELMERFRIRGSVDYAVVVDAKSGTVVDGHHRFEALRRMGAALVPVHLIDYLGGRYEVRNWRADDAPVTKADVVARAVSGEPYAPKTTRHDFIHEYDAVDVPLERLTGPDAKATRDV